MAKQRDPDYSYWQNEQVAFELKKQELDDQDKKKATGQEQSKSHEINQRKKDGKKADDETKKTIKLQKRTEIQQKRIEASHQPMNGIKLFNRWLRARRNPIYGILYLGLAYFIIQQQGWLLVGYIALFVMVLFPLILVSDNHMGHIRNFEDAVVPGISLLTLGIAGVITQYTTRDGSIPLQKSLANPSTFFTTLSDKERRAKVVIHKKMLAEESAARSRKIADINAKEQAKELQGIRALKQISSFLKQKDSTNFQLTYSDLNALCNTNTFVDHPGWEMQSFLSGPFGKEFGNNEVGFWLFLVRKKMEEPDPRFGNFAFYENSDSPELVQMVEKKLTKKDFQLLKTAYSDIPSQVRPYIEKNRDFLIQEERRQKELKAAIDREQLPELRIRELNLPIPRGAQNAWDFENICRDWLEAWGDTNVQVTQRSGDGGIDVVSDHCVAQVKFYADQPVGRPELQQLKGASALYGDPEVVFFAYNGYTDHAIRYAEEVSMCLFDFHAHLGTFNSRNSHANELIKALAHSHLPK